MLNPMSCSSFSDKPLVFHLTNIVSVVAVVIDSRRHGKRVATEAVGANEDRNDSGHEQHGDNN